MREETKTRLMGAAVALSTAMTLGALQAGQLGTGVPALQRAAALVLLSCTPYIPRVWRATPFILRVLFGAVAAVTVVAPVTFEFAIFLFLGHRTLDATVFSALWRVYVIMALWIAFARANESYIRPWLKTVDFGALGRLNENSVSATVKKMAMDKRSVALEEIKARMVAQMKRKKVAEMGIVEKTAELEKAKSSIEKADRMLQKSKDRLSEAGDDPSTDLSDEVETMEEMASNARSYEKGLPYQISRFQQDITESTRAIAHLKHEWTEALHIENYTAFYR